VKTIAEHLTDAGYATVGVGQNVHLERLYNFGQGFDEYAFPARGDWGISFGARVLECFDPHRFPGLFPSTRAIADVAVEKIRSHAKAPFFLWVHVLDPHWPYEPPPELVTAQRSSSGMGYRFGDHETVTNVQAGNLKLGLDDQRWVKELYKGEIRLMDQQVGRILDELRQLGLYDESLIVFASDHGEEFFEHGTFEHGHTLFDEVLRVPLAFKLPRASRKLRVAVDVSTESLAPTLLDLAGLELAPEAFDGPSLEPLVEGTGMTVPPSISTGTYYHGEKAAVVVDGYKYVVEYDTGRELLFHLAEDPRELVSLAAVEPEIVAAARTLLAHRVQQSLERRASMGLVVEEAELDAGVLASLRKLGYGGTDAKKRDGGEDDASRERSPQLDGAGTQEPERE
jgi:arylsulfatase A-like enzyme